MKKIRGWYLVALFVAIGIIVVVCYMYFYKGETTFTEGTMVRGFVQKCKDTLI